MDDRYCPWCHVVLRVAPESRYGFVCPECGEDFDVESSCNFAEMVELKIVWGTQGTLKYLADLCDERERAEAIAAYEAEREYHKPTQQLRLF